MQTKRGFLICVINSRYSFQLFTIFNSFFKTIFVNSIFLDYPRFTLLCMGVAKNIKTFKIKYYIFLLVFVCILIYQNIL